MIEKHLPLSLALLSTLMILGGGCGPTELCYEHTCNGESTGSRCFPDQNAYCSALCQENNCSAASACTGECGGSQQFTRSDTGTSDNDTAGGGTKDAGSDDAGSDAGHETTPPKPVDHGCTDATCREQDASAVCAYEIVEFSSPYTKASCMTEGNGYFRCGTYKGISAFCGPGTYCDIRGFSGHCTPGCLLDKHCGEAFRCMDKQCWPR